MTGAEHVSADRLADYLLDRLDDTSEAGVEEHLALCDACAITAHDLNVFLDVGRNWEPGGYAAAFRRYLVHNAIAGAEARTADDGLRARLRHWRERLVARAGLALGVLVRLPADGARLIDDRLENLLSTAGAWRLEPAYGVPARRGLRGASSMKSVVAVGPDDRSARVNIDATGAGIAVRLDGWPEGELPAFIGLVREDVEEPAIVAEPVRHSPADPPIAHFTQLRPGSYLVVLGT